MLAQGEFAAFLSAANKEKGYLLQQIIGEDIYLKIGETINQRLSEEQKKLDDIKTKINTEDLLTADERIVLKEEQRIIKQQLASLEKEYLALNEITNWYKKNEELLKQHNDLQIQFEKLEINIEQNKPSLDALTLNEKAEVFKELLTNIIRIDKTIETETNKLENLTKELSSLIPKMRTKKRKSQQLINF